MDNTILLFGFEFPDYVFFLIGIAISVGIYFSFDDEKRHKANLFLKEWGIWILIFFSWVFFRNRLGNFDYGTFWNNRANTAAILISLVYGIFIFVRFKQRYKSTQAICDNRHGSCAKYYPKGDYVFLNIGTTDEGWFPQVNGDETWIVPARHFKLINETTSSPKTQIYIKTNVSKMELLDLPNEAYNFFETESQSAGYNKDNIYYGEQTLEEAKNSKPITDENGKKNINEMLMLKVKNTQRMLNESQSMVKSKLMHTRKFVNDANVIGRKERGQGAYSIKNNQNNPDNQDG